MLYRRTTATFEKWWVTFAKGGRPKVGSRWRMDEAYIKVKGVWKYLYRAVDKEGKDRYANRRPTCRGSIRPMVLWLPCIAWVYTEPVLSDFPSVRI